MPRRTLAWLLGVAALTLLGAAVLYSAPTKEKDKDYEMVRLVVDTLHEVRERYVTPIDEERERQLVADMLKGGLERLDPHSTYIDPEEFKQFSKTSKGKFGGIGVHVSADRADARPAHCHQPHARHAGLQGGRPGRRRDRQDRRQADRQYAPQRRRGHDPGRSRPGDPADRPPSRRRRYSGHRPRPRGDPRPHA